MARLLKKNYLRTVGYSVGGIITMIAINTRENGKKTLTVTRTGDPEKGPITAIALAPGATVKPHLIEFEPGQAKFTQPTQIGNNRYKKPTVAIKVAGLSEDINDLAEIMDLDKTTFALELASGKKVLVGEQNGLQAEATTVDGGGAADDFEGLDTTVSGAETKHASLIPDDVWESLLALVPANA